MRYIQEEGSRMVELSAMEMTELKPCSLGEARTDA